MGDEMAIRSGGMYGNPASLYTKAMPSGFDQTGTLVSGFGKLANIFGTAVKAKAEIRQLRENQRALESEKQYNLENYQQKIADTIASNKMSFYASGLDVNSGTAQDVILSNTQAMQKDMGMMQRNYDVQIENLKKQRKARRISFGFEQASNVMDFVSGLVF